MVACRKAYPERQARLRERLLGKLIVLYDKNDITIEGSIDTAFDEDVKKRYKAMAGRCLRLRTETKTSSRLNRRSRKQRQRKKSPP